MSNELAIAAVTELLEDLIQRGSGSELERLTSRPPDKAREAGENVNQINVFLYQTVPSSAWRNQDISHPRKNEVGPPPLALHLYYLITAYGKDDEDVAGHRLLGKVMRILHDYPILDPRYIERVLVTGWIREDGGQVDPKLPESDLHRQVDRIRITPQPLSLDELSKLWTTFQTQYRISAAYEISVVLLDSSQTKRTPLPVLTRGRPLDGSGSGNSADNGADSTGGGRTTVRGDEGIIVQPNLLPPYPTLTSIHTPQEQQPSVRLGEQLLLKGHHLDGRRVRLRFRHLQLDTTRFITPADPDRTATEIRATVPNQPDRWPAGFYLVSALVGKPHEPREDRLSNELPVAIAPQIVPPLVATRDEEGIVSLTVRCRPQVWSEQRSFLILNVLDADPIPSWSDHELLVKPEQPDNGGADEAQPSGTLVCTLGTVAAGQYQVRPRLRVDGVDSFIVQDYEAVPLKFIDSQELII